MKENAHRKNWVSIFYHKLVNENSTNKFYKIRKKHHFSLQKEKEKQNERKNTTKIEQPL